MKLIQIALSLFTMLVSVHLFAENEMVNEETTESSECMVDSDNAKMDRWNNHDNDNCNSGNRGWGWGNHGGRGGNHGNGWGNGGYRCSRLNYWECSRAPNCNWQWNQCVSSNGGGGGHRVNCYQIDSWRQCENTYNCRWSRRHNQCVND